MRKYVKNREGGCWGERCGDGERDGEREKGEHESERDGEIRERELGECGEEEGERWRKKYKRERNKGEHEREAERAKRGSRWRGGEKQEIIRCLEIIERGNKK